MVGYFDNLDKAANARLEAERQYYKEFSVPRLNMSFTAHSTGAIDFSQYYSKLLDKNFYIFNKSYNVLDNTYLVNLREI